MDGLIPMAYRALKRSRTRQRYQCLSTEAARDNHSAPEFFYVDGRHQYAFPHQPSPDLKTLDDHADGAHGHRRCNSVGEFSRDQGRDFHGQELSPPRKTQLVRFSSHRRMFSCANGF